VHIVKETQTKQHSSVGNVKYLFTGRVNSV